MGRGSGNGGFRMRCESLHTFKADTLTWSAQSNNNQNVAQSTTELIEEVRKYSESTYRHMVDQSNNFVEVRYHSEFSISCWIPALMREECDSPLIPK